MRLEAEESCWPTRRLPKLSRANACLQIMLSHEEDLTERGLAFVPLPLPNVEAEFPSTVPQPGAAIHSESF